MLRVMPRTALVPPELTRGPFTLGEARLAGLTAHQLQGKTWRRLGSGLHVLASLPEDPAAVLAAIARRLPPAAAFSGKTAAWLHGLDVPPCSPIEVTISPDCGKSSLSGVTVRRAALPRSELVVRRGVKATSVPRALNDLAIHLSLVEAVIVADMALHLPLLTLAGLQTWISDHAGCRGVGRLRRVAELAEPAAESPMESRLRLLLVLGGLPRPQAQVRLYNEDGQFLGRPDLYYPQRRLAIEFDGGTHRDSLVADNRRQNLILSAGIGLLRFCGADVLGAPHSVLWQVRSALATAAKLPLPWPGKGDFSDSWRG